MIVAFILGLYLLREGLFNLSADRLKQWLTTLTDAPWKGFIVGIVVTAVLQNPAVSIIIVGFVAAKLLTFPQAYCIILGSNVGETITTEIISLDINFSLVIPMGIIGFILFLIKKSSIQNTGLALLGLSIIFGAMLGFKNLVVPLMEIKYLNELFLAIDNNHLYAVLFGTVLTPIIQSSTATTGIMMGFLATGSLSLDTAIAVILGANIGSTIHAWLASIGGGREARLTAYSNIYLNIFGVVVFFPLIGVFTNIGILLAEQPEVQLAHLSVIFNVISSLLALPFATKLANLIIKIHGR